MNNLRFHVNICLEGLKKTIKIFADLNLTPLKYKSEVLLIQPTGLVIRHCTDQRLSYVI